MKTDRDFAPRLIERALARGADLAEVYLRSAKNLSVEAKGQSVEALESSIDFGYSLRVITDKRLGFSFSTDPRDAEKVVEKAIEAARWTEQDEYLDLPGTSPAATVEVFDAAVASVTEEDAVGKALALEKAALDSDRRVTKVRKASASFTSRDVTIMNSRGLQAAYSATAATAQITVVAEDGGDSQMGWDFDGSRFLKDMTFEAVGKTAAARALRLLGARKMNSVKAPVLLDHSVAVDFLGIFSSLLSAESVQKGRSLLAHRLHEEVISPMLTLVDDGTMNHKLGSKPYDDEGTATSRKNLIEDGVLLSYMYNTRTARKDGVKSTGNALRGGFSSLPTVGPSTLSLAVSAEHVHPGNLFALPDRCLYVTEAMGIHTANPVSGEFSIGVSGLWIEKGIIRYAVKEAVISGNILEFFRKAEAAGDDTRFYGNMASPSLLFGPTDISA